MAQIFHRSTNTISRVSVFGGIGIIVVLVATLAAINRSSYVTEVGVARSQPVQFSHKHHVSDDGIDCRYCHTSVEQFSFAGIPSTKICMNCHTQIWAESPILEQVRESFRTGKSLEWTRVHNLPRASGSDAAHVAREHPIYGVVSRMPSESGALCSAARPGLQHGLATARGSDHS